MNSKPSSLSFFWDFVFLFSNNKIGKTNQNQFDNKKTKNFFTVMLPFYFNENTLIFVFSIKT